MTTTARVWIPDVPEEQIREMSKRIRPVFCFKRGLHYIKPVDLFKTAYTWEPKAAERAKGLKPLCTITTHHSYGYYGFFKPSIAEVLTQIPEEHRDKVVAFQIVERPETAEDLNQYPEALNAGYHVAKTELYIRE